jgi:hypothetical protein
MSSQLTIEQYSEKAIVVRGNTQPYKDALSDLGGKWNANLKGGGGWIFPNSKKTIIEKLNADINKGEVKESVVSTKQSASSSSSTAVNTQFVSRSDYLHLLARVERLEQATSHQFKSSIPSRKTVEEKVEVDDSGSEEESEKVVRMMKRKN